VQSDETVPDLTARMRTGGDWGHVQLAGILRRVGYEFRVTPDAAWRSGSEPGWGLNLSSAIHTLGQDRLLLQIVYGEGIASYMNDGGMDLAPQAEHTNGVVTGLHAQTVPLTGFVAYYDHWWAARWSSSIGYSFTDVDNTNFQEPDAYASGQYASVNLLHHPADNILIGAELMYGKRDNNDNASGDDVRFQFSVKYAFDKKL
jgi:hypothetical protein